LRAEAIIKVCIVCPVLMLAKTVTLVSLGAAAPATPPELFVAQSLIKLGLCFDDLVSVWLKRTFGVRMDI
jgi:hypothetical protein